MVLTLNLNDITDKWRDALRLSTPIGSFCTSHYSKPPSIYVGVNGQPLPDSSNCPMIIIYPGAKTEGLEMEEYSYNLTVGWSIVQSATTVTGIVTEYNGMPECSDLGQLIYLELAEISPDNPISVVNFSIEPVAYFPRFIGRMDVTLKIPTVNGYNITY